MNWKIYLRKQWNYQINEVYASTEAHTHNVVLNLYFLPVRTKKTLISEHLKNPPYPSSLTNLNKK